MNCKELALAGTAALCLPEKFNRPRLRRKLAAEYLEARWGHTRCAKHARKMGVCRRRSSVSAFEQDAALFGCMP
jgi:hypothetical protein